MAKNERMTQTTELTHTHRQRQTRGSPANRDPDRNKSETDMRNRSRTDFGRETDEKRCAATDSRVLRAPIRICCRDQLVGIFYVFVVYILPVFWLGLRFGSKNGRHSITENGNFSPSRSRKKVEMHSPEFGFQFATHFKLI